MRMLMAYLVSCGSVFVTRAFCTGNTSWCCRTCTVMSTGALPQKACFIGEHPGIQIAALTMATVFDKASLLPPLFLQRMRCPSVSTGHFAPLLSDLGMQFLRSLEGEFIALMSLGNLRSKVYVRLAVAPC